VLRGYGNQRYLHSFPTRRSSDLKKEKEVKNYDFVQFLSPINNSDNKLEWFFSWLDPKTEKPKRFLSKIKSVVDKKRAEIKRQLRSEEHTSELQSLRHLVCRLLLE